MSDTGYPIPAARHRTEQVISRSRFITTLAHTPDAAAARAFFDSVRAEFADATHNCWAFVAGPPGNTAAIGMSDAGEPHGTAGRPMLDVLVHSGVGEIGAVVTRYYGGTKLGTGGLVKAYGGSVSHALATLPTILRVDRITTYVAVGYGDVETLRRVLNEFGADLVAESYAENVNYEAAVPAYALDDFCAAVTERTAGRAIIRGG